MKLYFLQDELNELLNYIVCCDYNDYAEIHEKYLNCYFDLDVFNMWFFENYEKTMDYLGMPNVIYTKK